LSKQQERLIALAHGEATLEPNMRPTSARGNRYIPSQRPCLEYIDTTNNPRPVLQVPLPPKKRFPRETSLNTQRVNLACARQLFPPEERDKKEEAPYWNKLPHQPQQDLGQYVPWRGRNREGTTMGQGGILFGRPRHPTRPKQESSHDVTKQLQKLPRQWYQQTVSNHAFDRPPGKPTHSDPNL
jgi:hypothetical protein